MNVTMVYGIEKKLSISPSPSPPPLSPRSQAGQFIGSRADFVPEPICRKLALLCDKVWGAYGCLKVCVRGRMKKV